MIRDGQAFVELRFGSDWTYISAVRNFTENFIAITIEDKKRAGSIAMAVNELVENAVKYSVHGGIDIRLEVEDNNHIRVAVANEASDEEAESLLRILDEINGKEPLTAYLERMQGTTLHLDRKSSLGLARIRYEAGAVITVERMSPRIVVRADFSGKPGVMEG